MKMSFDRLAVIGAFALVCAVFLSPAPAIEPLFAQDDTIHFAVIFPGGPSAQGEGQQMIDQFIQHLADMAALDTSRIEGRYFNRSQTAVEYIRSHGNAYILGSTGFFLAHRKDMKLVPLTTLSMAGTDTERYYVLVRKGAYTGLDGLKGRTLSGNVLYEDERFLDAVVFGGRIDAGRYFKRMPTQRPLSALRKLKTGGVDAVLVNEMQLQALKGLPLYADVDTVFVSAPIPAMGLMMQDTALNYTVRDRVTAAVGRMCTLPEGRDVCRNFGLEGFPKIVEGRLDDVIRQYELRRD